jgi:hypothetical protein
VPKPVGLTTSYLSDWIFHDEDICDGSELTETVKNGFFFVADGVGK